MTAAGRGRRQPPLPRRPAPSTLTGRNTMPSLTDPLGPDLTATLRALKLGKLTATC